RAEEERPPTLSEKLRLLFDALYPEVADFTTQSVWGAGELLRFGGNFNKFVQARDLVKQEGILFRHLLRLILLCGEFQQGTPAANRARRPRAISASRLSRFFLARAVQRLRSVLSIRTAMCASALPFLGASPFAFTRSQSACSSGVNGRVFSKTNSSSNSLVASR